MAASDREAASAGPLGPITAGMILAEGSGELAIEAAPANVSLANPVIAVRVANIGGYTVSSVRIEVDAPPGVSAMVKPSTVANLAAGVSMLATITVRGLPRDRPAALLIKATGHSDVGETAAVTSVQMAPSAPIASLSLIGGTQLTDQSPTELMAVVGNLADVPVNVLVRATAGQQVVRLAREGKDVTRSVPDAPLALTVSAHQYAVVLVQVRVHGALQHGTLGLVVIAAISTGVGAESSEVTASQQLDVASSADILPGVTGVGSVLVIPGLVAVWAILSVWYLDRRRLGLAVRSAGSQIWDNKLWLLAAAAVSLLAAVIYSAAGFADLLDAYALSDIVVVTVATGLLGAAASAAVVWLHRRQVPAVTPASTELSVLKAASKESAKISRQVYRTPEGKRGLFVHRDWGAIVLTPPVEYTEIDGIGDDVLDSAVAKIDGNKDRIRFLRSSNNDYIEGPCAVPEGTSCGWEEILRYVDADLKDFKEISAPQVPLTSWRLRGVGTPPRSGAVSPAAHQIANGRWPGGAGYYQAPGAPGLVC
jgi:hypothetical protein